MQKNIDFTPKRVYNINNKIELRNKFEKIFI